VRHTPVPVTDADVEATLANLAEHRATLATVSRAARVGDFVVVDYELQPEGPRVARLRPSRRQACPARWTGRHEARRQRGRVTVQFPEQHRGGAPGPGRPARRACESREGLRPSTTSSRGPSAPTRRWRTSGRRSGPSSTRSARGRPSGRWRRPPLTPSWPPTR
jgi:hypothetical protein